MNSKVLHLGRFGVTSSTSSSSSDETRLMTSLGRLEEKELDGDLEVDVSIGFVKSE